MRRTHVLLTMATAVVVLGAGMASAAPAAVDQPVVFPEGLGDVSPFDTAETDSTASVRHDWRRCRGRTSLPWRVG